MNKPNAPQQGYTCTPGWNVVLIKTKSTWPVTYLGFSAPEDKVSLGARTQPVLGSIDAKSELEAKGRRKLNWTHMYWNNVVVSRPVGKLHMTVTSRNWREDIWTLKTIHYPRIKNLIFSRKVIPHLNFGQDWTFKLLYCDIPNCWNTLQL